MKAQAVTDKHFPPSVFTQMKKWPDLIKGHNAIHDLECEVMRERLDPMVMMARIESGLPTAGIQDETAGRDATPPQSNRNAPKTPSPPTSIVDQAPRLQPRSTTSSQPTSMAQSHRGSPMHRAVNHFLAVDGPAAPNPSPALSNHAGETLGNLRHLTERLQIASNRANSAGVVPQSRFASPAFWQGAIYKVDQGEGIKQGLTRRRKRIHATAI